MCFSMLCLEHDLDNLTLHPAANHSLCPASSGSSSSSADSSPSPSKSAPASPTQQMDSSVEVGYRGEDAQRGFFEGLLGCLRPVWTIIGKATAAELKNQGQGLINYATHILPVWIYYAN